LAGRLWAIANLTDAARGESPAAWLSGKCGGRVRESAAAFFDGSRLVDRSGWIGGSADVSADVPAATGHRSRHLVPTRTINGAVPHSSRRRRRPPLRRCAAWRRHGAAHVEFAPEDRAAHVPHRPTRRRLEPFATPGGESAVRSVPSPTHPVSDLGSPPTEVVSASGARVGPDPGAQWMRPRCARLPLGSTGGTARGSGADTGAVATP
jgi:hypothetical protein